MKSIPILLPAQELLARVEEAQREVAEADTLPCGLEDGQIKEEQQLNSPVS